MTVNQKTKDFLIMMIPILYIVAIVVAVLGKGFIGIFAPILITGIQLFLGLISGNKVDKKMVWILVIGFLLVHGGGMFGSVFYYLKYMNDVPDILIMGMHPSWFYFMMVYWLGSFLYLSISLVLLKDSWLSQEKWDNFTNKIKEIEKMKDK